MFPAIHFPSFATELRVQDLEKSTSSSTATLKVQHAAEVSALREEAAMAAESASQRYSSQLAQLSTQHRAELAQQRHAADEAQSQAQAAEEHVSKLQFELQSCERELASWRGKAQAAQGELKQHKSAAEAAGATSQQQAQGLTSAQMEIVGLKTQVRNLEELLGSVREQLRSEREGHAGTRESLEQHKDALRRLQEKLATSISEIEKGNRIITRLKEEHRVLRSKLKLQVSRAKQADMGASSTSQRLQDVNNKLAATSRDVSALREKLADKEAELRSAQSRLGEAQGIIAKNTAVIDHLNRSLSELEAAGSMGGRAGVYGRSLTFRSPAAPTRSSYSWEAGSGAAMRATPNPLPTRGPSGTHTGSDVAARVQARVESMAASMRSPAPVAAMGSDEPAKQQAQHSQDGGVNNASSAMGTRSGHLTQAERRQAEAMAGLDVLLGSGRKASSEKLLRQQPAPPAESEQSTAKRNAYFSQDFFGPEEGDSQHDGGHRSVFASHASEPSAV